jgi:hypothetical protein
MRARSLWLLLAGLAVSSTGCGITEPQQAPGAWDVTIVGHEAYPALEGTAGVASQFGSTTAAVRVSGYTNVVFTWRLHRGTCAAPGSAIGVQDRYPELNLGAGGTAEVTAIINQMLERDGEYSLLVRDTAGAVAGCGDLRKFDP